MRFIRAAFCATVVGAAAVLPASAGWDNVFQPTLFERWRQPVSTSQYYAPPVVVAQYSPIVVAQSPPVVVAQSSPCNSCAPCATKYVQRSYYQPVTTMENRTEMVAVTTMRTSYYYEPVQSVRYSSYYDPCSGCTQQVATPTTSYQLKAQSCPVQSWVSRCVQVPVQGVQKVDYWVPQTTCCSTTEGAPIYGTPPPPGQPPPQPQPQQQMPMAPSIRDVQPDRPAVSGYMTPGVSSAKPNLWEQYYPPMEKAPTMPGASFQPQLQAPVPLQTSAPPLANPQTQPPVRFDRIAVGDSRVEGQVVRNDSSPKANAKVLFVNASTGKRQTTYANTAGRFNVELPSGSWHVYLHGADDTPIYNARVDVNGAQTRQVQLVSRSN